MHPVSADTSRLPWASSSSGGTQDVPRPAERPNATNVSWVFLEAFFGWDVTGTPLHGGVQVAFKNRCPCHLSWHESMGSSSGSAPSSYQTTKLLTLSLSLLFSQPADQTNLCRLYPRSRSFNHSAKLMTWGGNTDRPVNRELHLSALLFLHHERWVQ